MRQRRRLLRYSLRTLLIVSTLFCLALAWLGWRVNRARKQESAIEVLKAKGTLLYRTQFDAPAIIYARLTGTWAYGDVYELVLSHDVSKPLDIQFEPQDIELLKDFPFLRILEIYSPQGEETIVHLAEGF